MKKKKKTIGGMTGKMKVLSIEEENQLLKRVAESYARIINDRAFDRDGDAVETYSRD